MVSIGALSDVPCCAELGFPRVGAAPRPAPRPRTEARTEGAGVGNMNEMQILRLLSINKAF